MFEQIKIEQIKKRKEHAFRKDIYLLGERKEDGGFEEEYVFRTDE